MVPPGSCEQSGGGYWLLGGEVGGVVGDAVVGGAVVGGVVGGAVVGGAVGGADVG